MYSYDLFICDVGTQAPAYTAMYTNRTMHSEGEKNSNAMLPSAILDRVIIRAMQVQKVRSTHVLNVMN